MYGYDRTFCRWACVGTVLKEATMTRTVPKRLPVLYAQTLLLSFVGRHDGEGKMRDSGL